MNVFLGKVGPCEHVLNDGVVCFEFEDGYIVKCLDRDTYYLV